MNFNYEFIHNNRERYTVTFQNHNFYNKLNIICILIIRKYVSIFAFYIFNEENNYKQKEHNIKTKTKR